MAKLVIFGSEIELSEYEDESSSEFVPFRTYRRPPSAHDKEIDPVALETAFLEYCMDNGWIAVESGETSSRYYLSDKGERELRRFGMVCMA